MIYEVFRFHHNPILSKKDKYSSLLEDSIMQSRRHCGGRKGLNSPSPFSGVNFFYVKSE